MGMTDTGGAKSGHVRNASATERLRFLLGEYGVKHVWKFDGNKMWDDEGGVCGTIFETQWESPDGLRHLTFTEYPNKERTTRLVVAWHPTPEQAVAATLETETCHKKPGKGGYLFCSECGCNITGDWAVYCPQCGRRVVEE